MAVAFQGVNGSNSASATSQTPAMPAGVTAGDLLLSECVLGASRTISVSAGWNIFPASNTSGVYAVAWRIATGGAEAPQWSWTGGATSAATNVWRYNGQWSGGTPLGEVAFNTGTSTTAGAGAITLKADNSYVVSFCGVLVNQTVPVPSNFTSDSNFTGGNAPERAERGSHRQMSGGAGGSSGSNNVTITSSVFQSAVIEVYSQAPVESSTINQTFANISQEIDVNVTQTTGTISQTFANISQALTASAIKNSTIDQTFANISQALTASSTHDVDAAVDQTLSGVLQELLVVAEVEITSVTSTFFPMEQTLTGSVGGAIHIAQTLPGLLQEVIVAAEIEITSLNQTLPGALQQVLECDQTPPVIIRMTFAPMTQQFDAVVEVPTYIDMTFISMDDYPRFAEIDMTFGGGGDCDDSSSLSRSGWWAGP